MASPTLGMGLLITVVTILMINVMGVGFQRSAYTAVAGEPKSRNQIAVTGLVLLLLAGWTGLAITLAVDKFFVTAPAARTPRISLAIVPLAVGGLLFAASRTFRRAIERIPSEWLVGVQVYRLLGGVFLVGYAQGLLPGVFALPAGWGDVFIGLAAPLVAWLLRIRHRLSRPIAVLWNLAGIADLVLAVTLGVLSAPGPFHRLALATPNVAIGAYPFVLIPTVLVPLSILLHLFSLRGLRTARNQRFSVDPDSPNSSRFPA